MKIGLIGRADRTGLGIETAEFVRHFPDTKVLIAAIPPKDAQNASYYDLNLKGLADCEVWDMPLSDKVLRAFLKGLDVLFTIETPYNRNAYKIAREMGVKTILRVNYEWLEDYESNPDIFLAPSLWHFSNYPQPSAYLPYPIATDRIKFRLRKKAKTFVHIAGNMKAANDRNGTEALIKAIPLVKNQNIKFIIKSQVEIPSIKDKRVQVICQDVENYWENWDGDGDVLVLPRRYAGQSLPLNEAMASGMAIMATNMSPQADFLPSELLIPIRGTLEMDINRPIEVCQINPRDIAAKIDEIAETDITRFSKISGHIAKEWSWDNLKPKYLTIFNNLYASNNDHDQD